MTLLLSVFLAASAQAKPLPVSTTAYALPLLPAPTQPLTVPLVIEKFEAFDAGLKSLGCDYTQAVRWDETGMSQTVSGSLEFKKPDLLRLEHRLPEPQTMVSDGSWLWIHRQSTNQVIKTRLEDWKKSEPLAQGLLDFGKYAGLLRTYDVTLSSGSPAADGHSDFALILRPKAKPGEFALILKLTTRTFFPAETELRTGSVSIKSSFKNIRYNPIQADSTFQFVPPKGADVFDNVRPAPKR